MTVRKTVRLSKLEIHQVKRLARERGVSISALLRGWIQDFLKSEEVTAQKKDRRVQIFIEPEILGRAEAKAMSNGEMSLRDVLRDRLAEEVQG